MSQLTSIDVVKSIVGAKGSIPLAAERMKLSEAELIDLLTEDETAVVTLQRKCNTLLSVWTFELIMNVQVALMAGIDEMTSRDIATLYTELLKGYSQLNSRRDDIARADVMSMLEGIASEKGLPPEAAQQAVKVAERLLRGGSA
jgi:hypothetical protein